VFDGVAWSSKTRQRFAGRPPLKDLLSDEWLRDEQMKNDRVCLAHGLHSYSLKKLSAVLGLHDTTNSEAIKMTRADNSRLAPLASLFPRAE